MRGSVTDQLSSKVIEWHPVYDSGLWVLADIYNKDVNIAIQKREFPGQVFETTGHVLAVKASQGLSITVSPYNAHELLSGALGTKEEFEPLIKDVASLVEMFCCLFEIDNVGLRLTSLARAMCPRFHVLNVSCRLVTTYCGGGTKWISHDCVERSKLGPVSGDVPDEQSGLFANMS